MHRSRVPTMISGQTRLSTAAALTVLGCSGSAVASNSTALSQARLNAALQRKMATADHQGLTLADHPVPVGEAGVIHLLRPRGFLASTIDRAQLAAAEQNLAECFDRIETAHGKAPEFWPNSGRKLLHAYFAQMIDLGSWPGAQIDEGKLSRSDNNPARTVTLVSNPSFPAEMRLYMPHSPDDSHYSVSGHIEVAVSTEAEMETVENLHQARKFEAAFQLRVLPGEVVAWEEVVGHTGRYQAAAVLAEGAPTYKARGLIMPDGQLLHAHAKADYVWGFLLGALDSLPGMGADALQGHVSEKYYSGITLRPATELPELAQ